MRALFFSDTHNQFEFIEIDKGFSVDFAFHSGDFTNHGTYEEIIEFIKYFKRIPAKHHVIIAGNHELGFEGNKDTVKNFFAKNDITYLEDDFIELDGWKIYGTPWQPEFYDWEFNLPRDSEELKSKFEAIHKDTEILLTHCPPHRILDKGHGENLGDRALSDMVLNKLDNLKIHSFGHIHSGSGIQRIRNKSFLNASFLGDMSIPIPKLDRIYIGLFDDDKDLISIEKFNSADKDYYDIFK